MTQTAIMGGLIIGMMVLCGLGYREYKRADELQKLADAQAQRITDLRKELADQAAVLSEREAKICELSANANETKIKYVRVANTPEVKSWSETAVPEAVSQILKSAKGERQ